MPTTSIPDAIVVPQDPGTSPADSIGFATDPPSAASVALLASYQSGAGNYVLDGASGGLSFTVDSASDELTIDPGVCYITQDATGTRVQSETGTTYDVSLPGSVQIVYAVVIPATVTVGLDPDSENTVYLSVDPDTRNSATAHAGAGLGTPPDPAIELGTVDSAAGTTVARVNDRPDGTYDALDARSVSTKASTLEDRNLLAWFDGNTFASYGPISTDAGPDDIGTYINQAISDGANSILLPAGSYDFNSDIVPTSETFQLIGQGILAGGTLLLYQGSGTAIDCDTNNIRGVRLQDFDIQQSANATPQGTGIHTRQHALLDNVRVTNFAVGLNTSDDGFYSRVSKSIFRSGEKGIVGGTNSFTISNSKITGNTGVGVELTNDSQSLTITDGTGIEGNGGWGVDIQTDSAGIGIENCFIEGNSGGVRVDPPNPSLTPVIEKNRFRDNGDVDILVGESTTASVRENNFTSDTSTAIEVTSDASFARVQPPGTIRNFSGTRISDSGDRTIIDGTSTNAGNPSTQGAWNGLAERAWDFGVSVVDTSAPSPLPRYIAQPDGAGGFEWRQITTSAP